uniref:BTB domain-containing protein n=1 Tax=Ditylum brightwellii TaxID=49249 RepID=A0A7S1ZSM2_9STRA
MNVSDVYLPNPAAEVFPLLLDYFYDLKTLDFNTKNAAALRYISNYFDVRDLYGKVVKFMESDLTIKTAPSYILAAEAVMDKELVNIASTVCAESFGQMSMEKLVKLQPKVVLKIISSPCMNIESEALSMRIAQYTRIRQSELTDELFFEFTQPKVMRHIAPSEAVYFLSLGLQYPRVLNEGGELSLKCRCIAACASSWTILAQDIAPKQKPKKQRKGILNRSYTMDDETIRFKTLPEELQVEVLQAALLSAKLDMDNGCEGSVASTTVVDKDQQLSDELYLYNAVSSTAPKIAVFGSGIPPLNGIFICTGNQTYEKDAYWKGKPVTFLLHKSLKRGQYRISVKDGTEDGQPLTTLYSSPIGGDSDRVPEVGWQKENGIEPPPAFVSTLR